MYEPVDRVLPPAITPDMGYWADQCHHVRPGSRPVNSVCVTLYNEPRNPLERTILSIVAALEHFHGHASDRPGWSVLCVMADGCDKLDPGVADFLCEHGLISRVSPPGAQAVGFFRSTHDLRTLRERLEGRSTGRYHARPEMALEVIVCLKTCNRGKLDSHALFFGTLCTLLQPEYCFQIDTGTVVGVESIIRMVEAMERDPQVAAVASRILPAVPSEMDDFLTAWQFRDLALQKAVLWPFEVGMGHLSVIPGQACVMRWAAVRGASATEGCGGTDTPLRAYLNGQDPNSVLENIMYLAEDRVLGIQLALAKDRTWRMYYAADVAALTDSCETFGELFRQRRRWLNSSLACRLWLLARYRSVLKRSDRDGRAKRMLTLGAAAQALLGAQELLLPTWFAGLTLLIANLLAHGGGPLTAALRVGYLGVLGIELLWTLFDRLRSQKNRAPVGRGIRTALAWLATGLLSAWVIAALPLAKGCMLVAGPYLALLAAMISLPKNSTQALIRGFMCPLVSMGMASLLSGYAYWNLADISWGTKGLRRANLTHALADGLKRFRNRFFGIWLGTNTTMIVLLVIHSRGSSQILNPAIWANAVTDALIAVVAVAGHLREIWRRSAIVPRREPAEALRGDQGHAVV
jgi:cellulose synthase/poly-beta-1,6-N-acetylglucosamine synthase-like glycosyltransferase